MPLNSQDQRLLTAAEGYVELGMFLDADAEVEDIAPENRHDPEVLEVRVKIFLGLQKWDQMRCVSRVLAECDPDNPQWSVSWAYATRRSDSIEAARRILLEAVERIPSAAVLHYNLACYESQLGDVEVAKARLKHAFNLEPRYRQKALEEKDLEAVWDSLSA